MARMDRSSWRRSPRRSWSPRWCWRRGGWSRVASLNQALVHLTGDVVRAVLAVDCDAHVLTIGREVRSELNSFPISIRLDEPSAPSHANVAVFYGQGAYAAVVVA